MPKGICNKPWLNPYAPSASPIKAGVAPRRLGAYSVNIGISKNKPSMRQVKSVAIGKTILSQIDFDADADFDFDFDFDFMVRHEGVRKSMRRWYKIRAQM